MEREGKRQVVSSPDGSGLQYFATEIDDFQFNVKSPADLLEDELGEDGESAAVHGVGHHPPLVIVQCPPGASHPELHHPPG